MLHLNTLMLHYIDIPVERDIYGEPKCSALPSISQAKFAGFTGKSLDLQEIN